MQPHGVFPGGNMGLTQQQLQQMLMMQQAGMQTGQLSNMVGYGQQYQMPAASTGQVQRPASATPPPGMAQMQGIANSSQHISGNQHQQPPARVSDTGDDAFDIDDIPSPGASPAGAGTGPAAVQSQQQPQQQQSMPYTQLPVSQPAAYSQQQPGQLQQQQLLIHQQHPQQQAQLAGRQQPQQQQPARAQSQPQQQPRAVQQQPPQPQLPHAALTPQVAQFQKHQQQAQQHGIAAATRPGMLPTAQQQLAAADQVALHGRKGGPMPTAAVKASPGVQGPAPGQELPAAAQAALAARQAQQHQHVAAIQQAQQQAQHQAQQQAQQQPQPQQPISQPQQQPGPLGQAGAAAATSAKRKRELPLLPAPDDALTLDMVLFRSKQGLPLTAGTSAGGPAVEGPAVSVDDILKKYEAAKAKAAQTAPKSSKAGAKDTRRADDENRLLPDSQLRRLLELQGLNKSFRLQPEVADEMMKLTDNFVTEALEFGCALATRRPSKVLRTSDLAMYMQRTYHLHIPGFSKEYTPYRRPVASDLHKARSVAVRKAQLQPQQGAAAGGAGA